MWVGALAVVDCQAYQSTGQGAGVGVWWAKSQHVQIHGWLKPSVCTCCKLKAIFRGSIFNFALDIYGRWSSKKKCALQIQQQIRSKFGPGAVQWLQQELIMSQLKSSALPSHPHPPKWWTTGGRTSSQPPSSASVSHKPVCVGAWSRMQGAQPPWRSELFPHTPTVSTPFSTSVLSPVLPCRIPSFLTTEFPSLHLAAKPMV